MRIRSEFMVGVASRMLVWVMRLLFLTVRVKKFVAVPGATPDHQNGENCHSFSIWHDSLLVTIFIVRRPRMFALVGRHRDGSYVSNVLRAVGIRPVRGSSSRGGAQAAAELIQQSRGHDLAMTPDGPRGPRRQMKPGCAFVASHTEKPVVPMAFSCSRAWHVRGSWTDLMIPKPFSTVYALAGPPIPILKGASRADLVRATREIQAEMDRLNEIAVRLAAGETLDVAELLTRPEDQSIAA
ncbi:lysophospholipid acyltransferase family protein [Thalassoglobus sp. JC818]|uniref:lysophospholipid acyltransferase family protein n=1 Tax=Thalassoglobus sp. JC818 TaxID=3232136 RepID=UPI0034592893